MKLFSCQILGALVLQSSAVFSTATRSPSPYYGPIGSKHSHPKHEPENFAINLAFENFREAESKSLGDEVREVLSQIIPVALAAAIKKEDPYRILNSVGDAGWSVVQSALVRISSILYCDDLSFVGGSGGTDSSELWENACRDDKRDAVVWHGHRANNGNNEGSNTIAICPSFFKRQGIAAPYEKQAQEYLCADTNTQVLMELRSALLLQELAQTSYVHGLLKSGDNQMLRRTASSRSENAQEVLRKTDTDIGSEQVHVEMFNLYVNLAWRRSICEQADEKYFQFDWMHSER